MSPLTPFIRWVGSKRRLAPHITPHIPNGLRLVEPFAGSGAVTLAKQPEKAWINDANSELMNLWQVIAAGDIDDFVERVHTHAERMNREYWITLRDMEHNTSLMRSLTNLDRAARYITIISNAYGGKESRNTKGRLTSSYGGAKGAWKAKKLRKYCTDIRAYLDANNVTLTNLDYTAVLDAVKPGDVVYIDPPYEVRTRRDYYAEVWKLGALEMLYSYCENLTRKGIPVIVSNDTSEAVRSCFKEWTVTTFTIDYMGSLNKNQKESLFTNYNLI